MKASLFLQMMEQLPRDRAVTLGEIADTMGGKGVVFLALVAVLPFLQPVPLPGLSSVLGLVIMLQGLALVRQGRPMLTARMRRYTIPANKMVLFEKAAQRVFPLVGWMVRPRGAWVQRHRATQVVAGLALTVLALLLSLPLPIPTSNLLPAVGIFCICLGLMEEDTLMLGLGLGYAALFVAMVGLASNFLWVELDAAGWWPF